MRPPASPPGPAASPGTAEQWADPAQIPALAAAARARYFEGEDGVLHLRDSPPREKGKGKGRGGKSKGKGKSRQKGKGKSKSKSK